MISLLLKWITSGTASLTIQHVDLDIDLACDVHIDSFSAPVCSKPPPTTFTTQAVSVASGEISAVAIKYYWSSCRNNPGSNRYHLSCDMCSAHRQAPWTTNETQSQVSTL